ncbi:MAG: VTT domain-containing protein [Chitinophagaceae bacterium]
MLLSIFDIEALVRYGGLLIVALMVYGSTGLFFCFFIPTGAFLFTAGIFVATGGVDIDIYTACALLILASVLGNSTGYWLGKKTGPLLYKKEDTRFYKKQHLATAETFYKKYGWLALTLGLYLPIIRTFASIVAGIVGLNFRRFLLLTISGSAVWILSFVLAGYFIGSRPVLKPWLKYIVIGFLLAVTIPLVIWTASELKKMRKENKNKKPG